MTSKLKAWIWAGALSSLALANASAQSVIFHEDFESGPARWTFEPGWYLLNAPPSCFYPAPPPFGATAARFGAQGQCFFNFLPGRMTTLDVIGIPANATGARLRFKSYESTECGFGNCGWDHRFVQVSLDSGTTWDNVWEGGKERLWIEKSVDLSLYRGQNLLVRFLFDPIDGWGNDFLGWMVDDVQVEIDEPGGPAIYCAPKLNSQGCEPLMAYSGDVSLSGPDDLVISTSNLRNNIWGSFAWSTGINNLPFQGGKLCVQIPARRTTTVSTSGTAAPALDCSGSYTWFFSHAYLLDNSIDPGETIYCQYFGRDVGTGFAPMTLSNAVKATILP
jgi:hypothetical protein